MRPARPGGAGVGLVGDGQADAALAGEAAQGRSGHRRDTVMVVAHGDDAIGDDLVGDGGGDEVVRGDLQGQRVGVEPRGVDRRARVRSRQDRAGQGVEALGRGRPGCDRTSV